MKVLAVSLSVKDTVTQSMTSVIRLTISLITSLQSSKHPLTFKSYVSKRRTFPTKYSMMK